MKLRFAQLGATALILLLSCTTGDSPSGFEGAGITRLSLSVAYPTEVSPASSADISRIRVTVRRASDRTVLDVIVTEVEPTASEWTLDLELTVLDGDPTVILLIELISVENGVETVEWSGETGPIGLAPGQTSVIQNVEVVQGPPGNLAVTSVTIGHPGALVEGMTVQLQAAVETDQPGAQTRLLWESSDATRARVSADGFLETLLPGTVQIRAMAGAVADEIEVTIDARPVGLRFVVEPTDVEVGQPFDLAPSVEAIDTRGDRVTNFTGLVSIELLDAAAAGGGASVGSGQEGAPGPGATTQAEGCPEARPWLNGTTETNAVNGLAEFPDVTVDAQCEFQMVARSSGLTQAVSLPITASPQEFDLSVGKTVQKVSAVGVLSIDEGGPTVTVDEGDVVQFTVTVTDERPGIISTLGAEIDPEAVTGATVVDFLPPGLVYGDHEITTGSTTSSTAPLAGAYSHFGGEADPSYNPETGEWDVGELRGTVSLIIWATVGPGTQGQVLVNEANLTRQGDTNPDNNASSATVTVRAKMADLGLGKSVSETSPLEGQEVAYTITVTNGGPHQADDIVIEGLVPDGLSITGGIDLNAVGRFDPDTRLWRIPTLAPGATTRLNVEATPGMGSAGQVLTNTVRVASVGTTDPNASNDEASISIDVQPAPTLPPIGEPLGPSYTTVGNTDLVAGSFSLPTTPHVADPDNLLFNTTFTMVTTTGTLPTANGGTVTIEADGDFRFMPAPGDIDPDEFSYMVNTGQTVTTTIAMQDMVWYVDNSAAFGGSGTSALPFTQLSEAEAASGVGDHIFVFEGNGFTTGMGDGITLKDDQKIVGEGQGLTIAPFPALVPVGNDPQLSNISGPGITLADNNLVRGLTLVGSQGPAILGSGIIGGTIDNVLIDAPSGPGILSKLHHGFLHHQRCDHGRYLGCRSRDRVRKPQCDRVWAYGQQLLGRRHIAEFYHLNHHHFQFGGHHERGRNRHVV